MARFVLEALHASFCGLYNGTSNGPRMYSGDFCLGYFLAAPVAESAVIFHPDELTEYK